MLGLILGLIVSPAVLLIVVVAGHRTHDTVRGKRFVREVEQMLQLA